MTQLENIAAISAALLFLFACVPAHAEQDNPRVVEPAVEPVDAAAMPKVVTDRAVEGSIYYVKINPEHLLDESLQTTMVDIWLSEDIGYFTVRKFRYRVHGNGTSSTWSGGFGGTALTFEGDTLENGFVSAEGRTFNLLRIKETGKHIVYEVLAR